MAEVSLLVSAGGTAATLISLLFLLLQIKHRKSVATADFTLKLCYEIFYSNYFINKRKRLANILLKGNVLDFLKSQEEYQENLVLSEVQNVLDFLRM